MRIAFAIQQFGESRGGAERAAANLASGLRAKGHEIHVFSREFEGADPGVVHHFVRAASFPSMLKAPSFARHLEEALAGEKFDVVQSFVRTHGCDVFRVGGGVHAEYMERVGVGWLGRLNPKHGLLKRLEARSFAPGAYRRIVAVSRRVQEEILKHYPAVRAEDIEVIHNGVDTARFRPGAGDRSALGVREGEVAALFSANGWRTKGLDTAIAALAKLADSAVLLVAGRGSAAVFGALARAAGVGDRVRFLGHRDDMERVYPAADLLVHPSLHDPFPNSCLEAMACGVPVIASAVTGVAEVMTDGRDGFVIEDARDADALADKWKLLMDERRRRGMSVEARRCAEGRSLEAWVEAYLQVYRRLG